MQRMNYVSFNKLKKYYFAAYIFLLINLLFSCYDITSDFNIRYFNSSEKTSSYTSISDIYPIFIQKQTNRTEYSIDRRRVDYNTDIFLNQSFRIYSELLKLIKLFDFDLKYLYKISLHLFSRAPPLILL
ncbi:MAG TPA: hypothetical protein PK771_00200 [Spirochaetota bacterium]|nr:hypothetical protein [Spirochaetota bacterium]